MVCCVIVKIMVFLEKLVLKLNFIEYFFLIGFIKLCYIYICIVDRYLFSLFILLLDYQVKQ